MSSDFLKKMYELGRAEAERELERCRQRHPLQECIGVVATVATKEKKRIEAELRHEKDPSRRNMLEADLALQRGLLSRLD